MKGIPVDKAVFDEVDHMDEEVIAKARGRMGASLVKEEAFLGNPIVPGEGVDKIFDLSDQRYWWRRCTCGAYTCAELSFPRCVKLRKDGTGYIGCDKCGKEVFIRDGQWQPEKKENSDFMAGYHWSQLSSITNDPADILREFNNPPEGNMADVYRLRLGIPYIAEEDRLLESQVIKCCNDEMQYDRHDGPCAMGVDVGKIKHVIIGIKTNNDQYRILKTIALSKWEDIHDIAKKFNVKSAVIDIRPYEDSARAFQAAEPYRIYLCEYKENAPAAVSYNQNTGIVSANRTEIFDSTHRLVTTPGALSIPRYCPDIKEFAKQVCGAYKVLDTNKKTGQSLYRYKGKNEHYRNALNYFLLAARTSELGTVNKYKKKQLFVESEYDRV